MISVKSTHSRGRVLRLLGLLLALSVAGHPGIAAFAADDSGKGAAKKVEKKLSKKQIAAERAHAELLISNRFPDASKCASCHPKQYREWSVSSHAYAQLSPVFNAMHGTILKRTNGTNGDFCIRCHTPVGMNLDESPYMSNLDRHPTSREGVTCIVCHRVDKSYGRISGRLAMVEGDLFDPVFGPTGNENLKVCLDDKDCRVNPTRGERGRAIHADAVRFETISSSEFCGTCHDVRLRNGFRLEDAYSEYNYSPAAARGETCQDCHMGKIPGVVSGYEEGPAAEIGQGRSEPFHTPSRKLTNHMFAGPDYSVIHPGIFPHNTDAQKLATLEEWLQFEWRDPVTKNRDWWGTEAFEAEVKKDRKKYKFPRKWRSKTRRERARQVLDTQLELLGEIEQQRKQILQVGYLLSDIETLKANDDGIEVAVRVSNGTDGHGVPTGFDAERLVFLQVTLKDANNKVLFRSGDLDPNGDVRDLHSLYVHNGELPLDNQLFSLQSKFLTRNVRGGEREQVIPVNVSIDPLPFLRPETRPSGVYGSPRGARKHKQNILPGGERRVQYTIDGDALSGNGPYHLDVKLIAGMIPINLLADIQEVGFDYGLSAKEIGESVLEGHQVLWQREQVINIHTDQSVAQTNE